MEEREKERKENREEWRRSAFFFFLFLKCGKERETKGRHSKTTKSF